MVSRITIKDIAKALNIHHSTVSRALRDDVRVKDETKKRIVDYANKMGYQTNLAALELRGGAKNTIAILVPNINHRFFSNIVSQITNRASENGYVVSVFQSNENLEHEKQIIDTIIRHNFSGVIASISMESKETEHFKKLEQHQIPLVMFDRVGEDIKTAKVLVNHEQVICEVVQMLARRGSKKVAYVSGPAYLNVFKERQQGYKIAIKELGLKYEKVISLGRGFSNIESQQLASKLFDEKSEAPDAIICDSSNLSYGIIQEIRNQGLSIPEDIALVVFGKSPVFEIVQPSICTIEQPEEQISAACFKLLHNHLRNDIPLEDKAVILPAEFIIRESI